VAAPPTLSDRGSRRLVPAALMAVYVIWGSTYLALRFMVEEFPPYFGNALRLLVAGAILFLWLRRRGASIPGRLQWRNAVVAGGLLFGGGMGLVTVAEGLGIGSGIAAMAVATTPVWTSLIAGAFGRRPSGRELGGLALGMAGVAVLAREGDFQTRPLGLLLLVIAPILWGLGSVLSNHLDLPGGSMRTALTMLGGAGVQVVVGALRGERFDGMPGASGWWAVAYLAIPGSLVAFSAYAYLLRTVRPALATSYAYVNPVVALALGVWLGGETIGAAAWAALPLILAGVALIAREGRP
jgi:drug/metabolite transporter (DMT)-like permease